MEIKYKSRASQLTREIDSYFMIVARMLEQLYADARTSAVVKCETIEDHPVRECALGMLTSYRHYRQENADADHLELALYIVGLHHG